MKNYFGISRDHSASMGSITRQAMNDYNQLINGITIASKEEEIDTIVSVVECGVGSSWGASTKRVVTLSSINAVKPITSYPAIGGSTPLYDSVGELIELMEKVPDAGDPEVTFVVMAVTDGCENSSRSWNRSRLANKMNELMKSGRWTFVFRVPRGSERVVAESLSLPYENVQPWDTTAKGMEASTRQTTTAVRSFYAQRKSGVKSSSTFFSDLNKTEVRQAIKTEMKDITNDVKIWNIPIKDHAIQIRSFIEKQGISYKKGCAFYQLVKTEKEVQDYKKIVIKDKKAGKTFAGSVARDLLGLPNYGTIKLTPGDHQGYDIYIQSTSVNRKLPAGSRVLWWEQGNNDWPLKV